jgi:hypothetical protein
LNVLAFKQATRRHHAHARAKKNKIFLALWRGRATAAPPHFLSIGALAVRVTTRYAPVV